MRENERKPNLTAPNIGINFSQKTRDDQVLHYLRFFSTCLVKLVMSPSQNNPWRNIPVPIIVCAVGLEFGVSRYVIKVCNEKTRFKFATVMKNTLKWKQISFWFRKHWHLKPSFKWWNHLWNGFLVFVFDVIRNKKIFVCWVFDLIEYVLSGCQIGCFVFYAKW